MRFPVKIISLNEIVLDLRNTFIIFFLFCFGFNYAQVKTEDYVLENPRDYSKYPARSANYIELLGNGGLYSLNYDYIYYYREKFKMSGRVGASLFPNGYYIEQSYVIESNFIFLKNPHHIEIGPGLTLQRKFNPTCADPSIYRWESIWFGMFRFGYRYQPQDDGFFLRAGITPVFYRKSDCGVEFPVTQTWFWAGVAVGVTF